MNFLEIANEVIDIEIEGLKHLKKNLGDSFQEAINLVLNSKGRVVITGMGKSGIIAKKISATLSSTGTQSFYIHPGEAYHGDLGMIDSNDVIIAISYSGETDEIIKLISFFKDNKNQIISISGNTNSTLGKHSTIALSIEITKEACPFNLAPTTSTTATLALGDAMAVALMKGKNFKPENFAKFHPGGSLGRKLLMKVKDVMKVDDLPISRLGDSFDEVIYEVSKGRLGMSVVLSKDDVVQGIITDGDIRRLLQDKNAEALKMKAQDFLTKNPKSINKDEKIIIAEDLMQNMKISTLLVVNSDHKLDGILHRYDM